MDASTPEASTGADPQAPTVGRALEDDDQIRVAEPTPGHSQALNAPEADGIAATPEEDSATSDDQQILGAAAAKKTLADDSSDTADTEAEAEADPESATPRKTASVP
jgi:hypothetical protein